MNSANQIDLARPLSLVALSSMTLDQLLEALTECRVLANSNEASLARSAGRTNVLRIREQLELRGASIR